jgi:hypothetical protein
MICAPHVEIVIPHGVGETIDTPLPQAGTNECSFRVISFTFRVADRSPNYSPGSAIFSSGLQTSLFLKHDSCFDIWSAGTIYSCLQPHFARLGGRIVLPGKVICLGSRGPALALA